jgi:chorismate synthase
VFSHTISEHCNSCIQRDEKDLVHVQSGLEHGVTLGTPIGLMVKNEDHRPKDYSETDLYPRPSHADWTYLEKYGVKASSGGGRRSARETIGAYSLYLSLLVNNKTNIIQAGWPQGQ